MQYFKVEFRYDLYNFNLRKHMCDQTNQLLPTPLLHNYRRIADLHNYNTRRLLYIDTKRTTRASTIFVQSGPRFQNVLKSFILSKFFFSKQLRNYILSTY